MWLVAAVWGSLAVDPLQERGDRGGGASASVAQCGEGLRYHAKLGYSKSEFCSSTWPPNLFLSLFLTGLHI